MIRAVVFDSDAPLCPDGVSPSPLPAETRLAGLTLLRRAALLAWRAGAEAVVVVTGDRQAAARWSASEAEVRQVPVTVIGPEEALPLRDGETVLLLAAQVLPKPALLERLLAAAADGGGAVAARADASPCWGAVAMPAERLLRATPGGEPVGAAVRRLLAQSGCCTTVRVEPGLYRRMESAQDVHDADRELYRGLASIADGYIDRVFNRHISGWVTRRIIDLPITPNHVTYFHFSLGLLGAWLFWQGGYGNQVVGALLFQLSVALDCVDGEVARLKFQFSKFGSWLDVAADNIVTIAVFVAIARAAAVQLGVGLALTLGALAAVGVVMCIAVIFGLGQLIRRAGAASSLSATNRLSADGQTYFRGETTLVEKVINEATSRDFSVLVVGCALLGRLEWFAWLAGVGSHLFWMIFALVQLSLLRKPHAQNR